MKSILLIEDDKDIRELTALVLTDEGYNVISIENKPSIEEVIDINPSLILIDHFLKGSNVKINFSGSDLCLALKSDDRTKNIHCVLFSGINDLEEIANQSLADAYINKPFDLDEFIEKIKSLT